MKLSLSLKKSLYIPSNVIAWQGIQSTVWWWRWTFNLNYLSSFLWPHQVSLKSLPIFLGDEGTGLKFFSSLLLRNIVIFPVSLSRNGDCHATHHNVYVTKLLLFHVSCFNIPKTPQLCSGPHHKNALLKHRSIVPPQHRTFSLLFLCDILWSIRTAVT